MYDKNPPENGGFVSNLRADNIRPPQGWRKTGGGRRSERVLQLI